VGETTPRADLLRYLADIGWDELRRPPSGNAGGTPRAASAAEPGVDAGSSVALAASRADSPAAAPATPRWSALTEVEGEALACRRCRLAESRQNVVFGSGDPHARLMFVGEGPGAEEDRQGLPFVGPAGELLTRIVAAIGLTREQVYIANVVKCRPPGNREPAPDEVAACRGYLEAQIDLVRPRVIVLLGRTAAQTLLGVDRSLARLRGQWHSVRGVAARVTYHPAALLRNPDYKRPTWEDMQLVRDRLDELAP
jgi:uracil-DNA glycosylase family 4